jgi:23S rRNA (cytidine1920-2'-O)/16S rRNA (cytidine1409-2'-O)-methyltransferase
MDKKFVGRAGPTTKAFASRAGEKLEFALTHFNIDVEDKICADFGAAVGGFVDCLLQHEAEKVYAVETGYGVLDWKLRNDSRVVVLERTNAMHVSLPEKMDLITNDTSWTRQEKILPNIKANLKSEGIIITLIKPHYEADPKLLRKGKLTEADPETVAKEVLELIIQMGFTIKGFVKSPILGGKGDNIEYLAYLIPVSKS